MSSGSRKARDVGLTDALDKCVPQTFQGPVWRAVRDGRDPLSPSPSHSRWCNGTFDVLYTSLTMDGAIAEIDALLSLQPVFPSKMRWRVFEIAAIAPRTLYLADFAALANLGVDVARYRDRNYSRSQEIADVASFLGFDGLIVPNARWDCNNLVLFTDRLAPDDLSLATSTGMELDWPAWRKAHAGTPRHRGA